MTISAIEIETPFKRRKAAVDALATLPPFGWVVLERDRAFYVRCLSRRPAAVLAYLKNNEQFRFREVSL